MKRGKTLVFRKPRSKSHRRPKPEVHNKSILTYKSFICFIKSSEFEDDTVQLVRP